MQHLSELPQIPEVKKVKCKGVGNVEVRKATEADVDGIYNVASSVGNIRKESYFGFLMDDYNANPDYFKKIFLEKTKKLKFFFVAEMNSKVVGFLMGYTREEWLCDNPEWVEAINWKPGFDLKRTDKFVLTDKIAVLSDYTGCGIGSRIYSQYMKALRNEGVDHIFSETLIDPVPNFASLSFRKKQSFKLAGTRYEDYEGVSYTDLIYYKPVEVKTSVD